MPNLSGGGAERVAVNLANTLVHRGHKVDMVLLQSRGALLDEVSPFVRVISLDATRFRQGLVPLVRYLRVEKPDAMLANMWPLTVLAVFARRLASVRTRVVVAEHTTWSRSELLARPTVGWQVRNSMHYFFPKADGIVTVSKGAADDLARFARIDRSSITVIYNPVVGAERQVSDAVLDPSDWWSGSHKRILAVGTLKAVKDYGTLFEAFAVLLQKMDARLLILGEGECRGELEARVRQLRLEGHVFMPGFFKDAAPYYQRADLHVLSSICEGFGNVIAEALAAGTPVVSTDCPSGPREILADGKYGRLVPVGDVQALASAMADSLVATHDRSVLKARAQDFSIDKAVDQYEALLFPQRSDRK